MAEITLKVKKRTEFKKSISKELRKSGMIPGVIYGSGSDNIPIVASELILNPIINTSESRVINLELEGEKKTTNCILKDLQYEPLNNQLIHFDLLVLKKGESINIEINVILKETPIGVKEGGILQQVLHKLEVQCLPKDIPTHVELDVSELSIGDSIKVNSIKLENATILNDENSAVAIVVPPTIEKEPEVEEEEEIEGEEEPEIISKGKKEEGEEEKKADTKEDKGYMEDTKERKGKMEDTKERKGKMEDTKERKGKMEDTKEKKGKK
jgi:large subunit ribosomal protein L25